MKTNMWFKNIIFYNLTEKLTITKNELQKKLEANRFRKCGEQELYTSGWVSPVDHQSNSLAQKHQDFFMICLQREEKILPPAAIKRKLDEEIAAIESVHYREINRKEKNEIREEIIFDMMKKAFTKISHTYAYIDLKNNFLVIDAASRNKAEDLTMLLRNCLGSLKIKIPDFSMVSAYMTAWLHAYKHPDQYSIGVECELKDFETNSLVKIKNNDLATNEVKSHLESGKVCTKLELNWCGKISFILCEDLAIKRLVFDDLVIESVLENDEDLDTQFNADFEIMATEISGLLCDLIGK